MRTIAVWLGAVLIVGGLWSASVINQGLADEPAAPSSASEATGGTAGNKAGGSEAVPPVVEGESALPAESGEVQSRAVPQLVRIQNHWKPWQYVHIQSGPVAAGPISVGWTSARWYLELIPGSTVYRIQNVWQGDRYLNIESGALQASTIAPGWVSARWTLEPVAGTVPTLYRIRNVWKPDQYLNIESGALQASAIQPGWLSAMWTLSFDATVVAAPAPPPITGPTTGGTLALPDRYTAPTPNLTMVANALSLRHKSLTTLVTVSPNLPVTQPVSISIGYYSPIKNGRITESYVRETGNRFLYLDAEGDGHPRQMRLDISLAESLPGGKYSTFSFSLLVDLDPLYGVAVSPFKFYLLDDCDLLGDSEIRFKWWSPDDLEHKFNFTTLAGGAFTIDQFAWARQEVSALQDFRLPGYFSFREYDPFNPAFGFSIETLHQKYPAKLLPGKTHKFTGNLDESSNSRQCTANYEFTITYTLRWYPEL